MVESIEIVSLDEDDDEDIILTSQVSDVCDSSSINFVNTDSPPIRTAPEFVAALNKIQFDLKRMSRKKLETFCFSKIQAEIEFRSLYQEQMKENENLNNNLSSAQVEISLLRDENNKLLQSLQLASNVNTRHTSCQTDDSNSQTDNNNSTRPLIKVRDFSKQKQRDDSQVTVSSSSRIDMDTSMNLNNIYYVLPMLPLEHNNDQSNNLQPNIFMNKSLNMPTISNALSKDISKKGYIKEEMPLLNNPVHDIIQTQSLLSDIQDEDHHEELNKSFDIEDNLPHALITCSDGSKKSKSNDGKHVVEVYKVLKSIDLTKTEHKKNSVPTTSQDNENLNNMPVIISSMSLAPNSVALNKETDLNKSSVPQTTPTGNSHKINDNSALNIIKDPRKDENTNIIKLTPIDISNINSDIISKLRPRILKKVNFGIVRPDCQTFDSSNATETIPNSKTNMKNPTINATNVVESGVNITNEVNCIINKITNVDNSNVKKAIVISPRKKTNPNVVISLQNKTTNEINKINEVVNKIVVTDANLANKFNSVYSASNIKTNLNDSTTKKTLLVISPKKNIEKGSTSSLTSTSANSLISNSIAPSTSTPKTLKSCESKAPSIATCSKMDNKDPVHTTHVYQTDSKNEEEDSICYPPAKKMRMEESPIFKELQKQMSDKFYNAFENGNISNGISIKLDVDGFTKVITCSNINTSSLKKIVSRQDCEKDAFIKIFAKAVYNKINKTVGFTHSGRITIRRCDLLKDSDIPKLILNKGQCDTKLKGKQNLVINDDSPILLID